MPRMTGRNHHRRRKYNKDPNHTGGAPSGQGKNWHKNRDHSRKKIKTRGRFPSITARIAQRNTNIKRSRLGKV